MNSILLTFDRQFLVLDKLSRELLQTATDEMLFQKPRPLKNSMAMFSVGEYILRSAAMVEQTFGGITTRLWDDPFEWTLPEKLSDIPAVINYLDEVDATRIKGFTLFLSDKDLMRELPAPERLLSVAELLLQTISRAQHYQGRAFAVFQMLSDEKLPRF